MSEQRHTIRRQVIELTVRDAAHAERLHDEVSRIYRQRIVPLIDRCCSELSAPDQLYRIDRLELELGVIDERELEAELVARVGAALRPALAARIAAQATSGHASRAASWLELLELFARTGSLPWWADAATLGLLESGLRYLLANAAGPLGQLIRELAGEPGALRRLIDHLPDAVLVLLAAELVPVASATQVEQMVGLLRGTGATAGPGVAGRRRYAWGAILRVAGASGPQHADAASFYGAVLRRAAGERGVAYTALLAELRAVAEHVGAGQLDQALLAALSEAGHARPLPPDGPEAPADARKSGSEDAVYIGNAGLVILWPFLPDFFASLGLVAGAHFSGPAAQQRAVGLLQHLATGDAAFAEYLLPLNKLLCGLELDALFDFGEPLAEAETEACAEFLRAVITQAPILRDMSLPGFRGTFLLRQAALSARDGAWLLRVERQTYDVVLDRFPWGWEWLRLPWMDAPLRVEW